MKHQDEWVHNGVKRMEIEIPFSGWSKMKVREGKKRCTSRRYQMADPGDIFRLEGGMYQITKIEQVPLIQVRDILFREEGTVSPEQFERIYRSQHHFWEWDETEKVYVHHFDQLT